MKKKGFGIWILRFLFCLALILIYHVIVNFKIILEFFNKLLKILQPFLIGGAISFLFYPLCKRLENLFFQTENKFLKKRARGLSTAIVVMLFIFLILSLCLKVVPVFYETVIKFLEDVSYNFSELYSALEEKAQNVEYINSFLKEFENKFSFDRITKFIVSLNYRVYVGGIANFIFKFVNFFIGFIISIYILLDRHNIKRAIIRILNLTLKEDKKNAVLQFCEKTATIIYTFIFGQIVDAFIVGCSIGAILSIFKINNSLIFAVIYFILAIIPYFGPISAVILISFFSYVMGDFNQFITCSIITLICQQIDAHFVNPKIVGQIVGLKPLYVILGIMLFGGIFGAVGFFLGPALMVVFLELIDDILTTKEAKKKKLLQSSLSKTDEK